MNAARWSLQVFGALLLLALFSSIGSHARGDGVANVLTSKAIPQATVDVIDPESGTSGGGGTTDVRVAAGDIILFTFNYSGVPDKIVRGLAGYLTEFIPNNTEVVGVRIVDRFGLTVRPNYPGIATNGCGRTCNLFNSVPCSAGVPGCAGGTRNLDDGSISQMYADTGVFYASTSLVARTPNNQFLRLNNGTLMDPEPTVVNPIRTLLGAGTSIYTHNAWDYIQVQAYGISNPDGSASGNNGTGNTPYRYGSPVAGPLTHYRYEATQIAPMDIRFNDVDGPWQRVQYPGSLIGTGAAVTGSGPLQRMIADAATMGFDVRPSNPIPRAARALRVAFGETRVGEPGQIEIALRVLGTPLDTVHGADINCGEVHGGDTSAASDTVRARDNPWGVYLASPNCVFLNLKFDLAVSHLLAPGGTRVTYTISGKNLSTLPQTNVLIRLPYDSTRISYVPGTATGGGVDVACGAATDCPCTPETPRCIVWPRRTLSPSDEYTFTSQFDIGGGGHVTAPTFADYVSTQLPEPGFRTQAISIVQPIALVRAALASTTPSAGPGGTISFSGNVRNDGTANVDYDTLTVVLPAGWTISGPLRIGGVVQSCLSDCGTSFPTYTFSSSAFAQGESRTLTFDAQVAAGAATGIYDVDLQIWARQGMGFGGNFETYFPDIAQASVGAVRSTPPVLDCPILATQRTIPGSTIEADGTVIRIYFNLINRGSGPSAGGRFNVGTFGRGTTFGELYGGLEVRATAQAPGELESPLSAACFVSGARECSDGLDNDGDGLIDFPADPGCTSLADSDESDTPQCSDGLDNDGDGLVDFPADFECSSPTDTTEGGPAACQNMVDDDGDGLTDFPADPDCSSATDRTEVPLYTCFDRIDNDADARIDFTPDPGCHDRFDADERDPSPTPAETRARFLIAFDTSGSMNWNTCNNTFTGGDGSVECPGNDVLCPTCGTLGCGNLSPDDSRIDKAKRGLSDVIAAYGEVEYALMRFRQSPRSFVCPSTNASLQSGGWQGAGAAPCGGGFNAGELLVGFSQENQYDMLAWMDGRSNHGSTPAALYDRELRGTGTTPLGGILSSARTYLDGVRAADTSSSCRPYVVILLTDGNETCGGNPVARAGELRTAGYPTYVIGFGLNPADRPQLDAIAASGGTTSAILATNEAELSAAITGIIASTVRFETCNGLDDDCDLLIDEGFTLYCDRPRGITTPSLCADPGERVCDGLDDNCDGRVDEGLLNACGLCGATPVEVCDLIDNDCDGMIDEGGVCPCPAPEPERCDNIDNDCDMRIDEGVTRPCGTDVGECTAGIETCVAGVFGMCTGTGPTPELCDNLDNDCDGVIDGLTRPCGSDVGECAPGIERCVAGMFGACTGGVGPRSEICDNLDNDCDTRIDEGVPGVGVMCGTSTGACEPGMTACVMGRLVCTGGVSGTPETCDSEDDDCDGEVDEGNPGGGTACGATNVGECERGAEVCVMGMLVCMGEIGPRMELCDSLDNDCDGMTDEGNPEGGATCGIGCAPGVTCRCMPGTTMCVFPPGELRCDDVGPIEEICNAIDDDCDGVVDDGIPVGAPCGTDVGECVPGINMCDPETGEFSCEGEIGPEPEVCNALDDDCDGEVDEELPLGGPCGMTEGICEPGMLACIGGREVCDGEVPAETERCDCSDNDCDMAIDEGDLCPSGSSCVDCTCALPCTDSEFGPCPPGRIEVRVDGECFCVPPACDAEACAAMTRMEGEDVVCAPDREGELIPACDCISNECTYPCAGVVCDEAGTVCDPLTGRCVEDSCRALGCPTGEICDYELLECVDDPCLPSPCEATEACRAVDGAASCEASCADVDCDDGERCVAGACVDDLCVDPDCPGAEICDPATGDCGPDMCVSRTCRPGEVCDPVDGGCEPDPCRFLHCPEMQMCVRGECQEETPMTDGGPGTDAATTDGGDRDGGTDFDAAPEDDYILASGGGGCACRAGAGSGRAPPIGLLLIGLFLVLVARRRR